MTEPQSSGQGTAPSPLGDSRPWTIDAPCSDDGCDIIGANGEWIADVRKAEYADLTVRAVNSHAALLSVAQELDDFQRVYQKLTACEAPGSELYAGLLMQIVTAARAALAKAEAKS